MSTYFIVLWFLSHLSQRIFQAWLSAACFVILSAFQFGVIVNTVLIKFVRIDENIFYHPLELLILFFIIF